MDLVIDIGNTLCKIGIFDPDGTLFFFDKQEDILLKTIESLCETYSVKRSMVSSVRAIMPDWTAFLASHTLAVSFSHTLRLPITLNYTSPHTLGLDRIANAVAAACYFPDEDVLSIQAGTCVVYDFTDRHGAYHGGAISPGLEMRFNALKQYTGKLPLVSKNEIDYYVGNDTQQSIKSGVINGLVFEIQGFMNQYQKNYPLLKTVLTGGDAEYLQKSVKNVIFADSNFILKGLHEILKINAEKI
ncbi:MAG: type III pantothenate kinase [Bacteroidales bacterium]|jgi:type III pantothenate kinase|nr:type III pantothenate kinase [Bacteroidales bacterium]